MICSGCYTEVKEGYCLACRKKLFGKMKVAAVLPFDAPAAENIEVFQKHSKRLSISGVQLKYSARLENGALQLTDRNGEYILKPIPPSKQLLLIEDAPENEHLTMQIAEQFFKINTAANVFIRFRDGQPAYLTKRFDVKQDGSKYMQEDFAQLMNRSKHTHGEAFKYTGTYEDIGSLIKKYVAASMPVLEKFFQLVLFNYVFSNGDAHLKNFSLTRNDEGEYLMAPAYDLMCTVIHTPHESDTALDLYENDIDSDHYTTYGYYGRDNFMELAKRLGLVAIRAERIMNNFSNNREEINNFINASFLSAGAKKNYLAAFEDKLKRIQA